jgi:hypothetical protein
VVGELLHLIYAVIPGALLCQAGPFGIVAGVLLVLGVAALVVLRLCRGARCTPTGLRVTGERVRTTVPYDQVLALTWTESVGGRTREWAKTHVLWQDATGRYRTAVVGMSFGSTATRRSTSGLWSQLPGRVDLYCGRPPRQLSDDLSRLRRERRVRADRHSERWGWVQGEAELFPGRVVHHLTGARKDETWHVTTASYDRPQRLDAQEDVVLVLEGTSGKLLLSRFLVEEVLHLVLGR